MDDRYIVCAVCGAIVLEAKRSTGKNLGVPRLHNRKTLKTDENGIIIVGEYTESICPGSFINGKLYQPE